jgi:hypothetical protein
MQVQESTLWDSILWQFHHLLFSTTYFRKTKLNFKFSISVLVLQVIIFPQGSPTEPDKQLFLIIQF